MQNKVLCVLPCRLESSRLKQKHLIKLPNEKTIFQMTYEKSLQTQGVDKTIIATDSQEVLALAKNFTDDCILTPKFDSGTSRVAYVAKNFTDYSYIVNLQGDEPNIHPSTIKNCITTLLESKDDINMVSAMTDFTQQEDIAKPENVKVIINRYNEAIYFSRAIIPFNNSFDLNHNEFYKKHIGIYCFKSDFLQIYDKMPPCQLEKIEGLEQLRVIQSGYKIKMVLSEYDSIGIDTPSDLKNFEKVLNNSKS